ncbi:hypothetical protein [Rathayibacter sp. AY1B8]|uniref:hypothetical protein n=1 Tax=Rathayibacter sp. AY1B8 TaxID=2080533 RepID=UPI0011B021CF|nr:hypothetical protein [Rathayibacter sp. AY1B8]
MRAERQREHRAEVGRVLGDDPGEGRRLQVSTLRALRHTSTDDAAGVLRDQPVVGCRGQIARSSA